jgi:hypothetical protein
MEKISYSDIVRHNHACVVSSIAHLNNLVGGMSADSRAQYAIVNRVVAAGQVRRECQHAGVHLLFVYSLGYKGTFWGPLYFQIPLMPLEYVLIPIS